VVVMFRLAAERRVPVFVHVRSTGRREPGSSIESMGEVIAASAVTGAALHIVHMNSSGAKDAVACLALVEGARAHGLDVTTEAYPYGAGMTAANSAVFDPGWQEKLGLEYKDLELPDTGERLTRETFDALHASPEPRLILIHTNPDELVDAVVRHPLVMIASDGLRLHPRNAGTFARVLARYPRVQGSLGLMDALRKMTLMPARRLETATAAARRKGRLQEGTDADVVVFDPATIADRATYRAPAEPSVGVRYLLVSGTPVVDDGRVVEGVFPGRALVSDRRSGR
jgi:N-acyl-D-aspartate/D-glutamate deacylase